MRQCLIAMTLLCAICTQSAIAHVVNAELPAEMNNKITYMIKSGLPDATVGVTVQDIDSGKILYDYHGSKHFLPASTTKLFTAAAALKLLGPDYRYNTILYYKKPPLPTTILTGDVALKFTGDPTLQLATLQNLLKKLTDAHIKEISGNLIIDDTLYEGPLLGFGWTWDSTPWYHAAPVAAIIIDRNQFGITLFPATQIGLPVGAALDPMSPGAKSRLLKSDIHGVTLEDSEIMCQIAVTVDDQNNVELGGCWPLGTQPVHLRLALKNPRLHAQQLLLETLDKLNVKFSGQVIFGAIPIGLTTLARHESESLAILLNAILGDSNNLYAESLTKTLGANMYKVGSFKTGSLAVQKTLSAMTGIDFAQIRLLDGSGESRYNLLTPMHLTRLLYTMHHEPKIGAHFRNALAISGVNGTLKKRFGSFDTKDNIKAKTGTLNGASTLAGYFTTRSNRHLIVTIMINHAMDSNTMLKQFENELCYFLVNQL